MDLLVHEKSSNILLALIITNEIPYGCGICTHQFLWTGALCDDRLHLKLLGNVLKLIP